MRTMAWVTITLAMVASAGACGGGSGGVYCQGGPKYGTQCYSPAEVRQSDPTQPPTPPNYPWKEPAKPSADAGKDPFIK